ncbi:stage II sporulation protein P [Bacillus lacus]|uniref:Stage II sporulation protein P n=2 Tax=Metabacillus lacus TaxID=1983721 RepID=A0A7X2IWX3_9BACI|nr:stage II sporulation protein P [Metabacillus lacus]
MVVSVNGTSLFKVCMLLFVGLVMTFLLSGILTSLKPEYRISSDSFHTLSDHLAGEVYVHILGMENRYFTGAAKGEIAPPSISGLLFKVATSINPDDPRSLLGRELPGFSIFDSEILVAGEGTNYTNVPMESAPPTEVLANEREASIESLEAIDKIAQGSKSDPSVLTTGDRKVVYIYHTHTTESYLPLLKDASKPSQAFHSKVNVTLVGDMLGKELESRGVGASVDKTNVQDQLKKAGWKYSKSYTASRQVVETAMAANKDMQYLIDIHRDVLRKKNTTISLQNKNYAKIAFVVGGDNPHSEKNEILAKELHNLFEKKFPGLSRGVIKKKGAGTNGIFNQDLSASAMLLEVGGVDNNLEELKNTSAAIAEVISQYYWDAEKVNAEPEAEKK